MLPKRFLGNLKKWLWFNKKRTLILFCLLVVLTYINSLLEIKKVSCTCNHQICENDPCIEKSNYFPKSFIFFNKKKLVNTLNPGNQYQKVSVSFKFPQALVINFEETNDFLVYNQGITNSTLNLSFESAPVSTESMTPFSKPSQEIAAEVGKTKMLSFKVLPNGHATTIATEGSKIISLTTQKTESEWYQKTYRLIKLVSTYYDLEGVYLTDQDLFFYNQNKPDLLIDLQSNEEKISKALQVLGFLTTIKQDPKIIDLRYTNPIIR